MKAKLEKVRNKKTIIKVVILAFVVIMVGYCAYALISNAASISVLQSQDAELKAKYAQQINDNDKIKDILESDNKDEYIEQKAREKGYVREGEEVFYDISSSK